MKKSGKARVPKLLVVIEGGNVQHFSSTGPVDLLIVDWDNAKADPAAYQDEMDGIRVVPGRPGYYAKNIGQARSRLRNLVREQRKMEGDAT